MFRSGLGRVLLRAVAAGACSGCAAKCHLRVSPEVSQCAEGGGAVIMLHPATILASLAVLAAEAGSLVSDTTTVTLLRSISRAVSEPSRCFTVSGECLVPFIKWYFLRRRP